MKIALYIEDGLEQIVLTPTTKHEQQLLDYLHDSSRELHVKRGRFYENMAGYVIQGTLNDLNHGWSSKSADESTMLVLKPRAAAPAHDERN